MGLPAFSTWLLERSTSYELWRYEERREVRQRSCRAIGLVMTFSLGLEIDRFHLLTRLSTPREETVMIKLPAVFAALALLTSPAVAAPCRDSHGKFVKCPTTVKKVVRCKDAKGKFVKCGTKGAKPA